MAARKVIVAAATKSSIVAPVTKGNGINIGAVDEQMIAVATVESNVFNVIGVKSFDTFAGTVAKRERSKLVIIAAPALKPQVRDSKTPSGIA